MSENYNPSRRNFIVGLTALMGSAMVASACHAAADFNTGAKAAALSDKQLKLVELIGDIIIPDTDTPGAAKADVHGFINHMLAKFMRKKDAKAFMRGLAAFDAKAGGFLSLPADQQVAAVADVDKKLKIDTFYSTLKGLVITGYYTSKIGASEELAYDPIPGQYHEIPFSDIGRIWVSQ